MSNDTPIDLDRLEALANDPRILPYVRPGWTILNTETLNLYNAARTALPTLIAAYRQLTIVATRADALAQADADLIRALEGRLSQESAENEQLRAIIDRATDHALAQLQAYRSTADANGDGTATYYAALCHHYTQMVSVLRSPNE